MSAIAQVAPRAFRRFTSLLWSICLLVTVSAWSAHAAATSNRPYFAGGTAQFVSPDFDFVGQGYATHLGRYTEAGHVAFTPTGNPAILHVDATSSYFASNGDELRAVITGELNGQTGAITATVEYVGGTGRFASASGSSSLTGQLLADGSISVSVGGTLDY